MPTIIDSLIVELGLDSSKFVQGQKQATQSLHTLQTQASQSIQQIGTATTNPIQRLFVNIQQFFTGLQQPIQAATAGITNIGTQAQRTGGTVAHSAGVGAQGLTALTAAGLGTFAVLKSIQEIMKNITTTMASTAAFGRLASAVGFQPNWFSQISTAAHLATNTPKEATQQALAG